MKHAFISHSSADKALADEICRLLEDRGVNCWIAPRDIPAGSSYGEEILRGIEHTVATVLVLSENSNNSVPVRNEIERAFSYQKAVIPVRIRNIEPSKGLEFYVASAQWIDAWESPLESKMDSLAQVIMLLATDYKLQPTVQAASMLEPKQSRLLVYSDSSAELRNPPSDLNPTDVKMAVRDALIAIGGIHQGVKVGAPSSGQDGDLKFPVRVSGFGEAPFDSVHFDIFDAPEIEVTFFRHGNFVSEAKAAVETNSFHDAARILVQLLHPKAGGDAFVSHHYHGDGSGHSTVSFLDDN